MLDYQRKGFTRYGAFMGRSGAPLDATLPLTLRHVALTDGGYDHGGAYWGGPNDLYLVSDTEGGETYLRGTPDSIRAQYPGATWAPVTDGPSESDLSEMLAAYIECALWSSTTGDDEPLDRDHSADDLAPETREAMRADCEKFAREHAAEILACFGTGKCSWAKAGHDFWLTRNGHGCGFWDGDWPEPHAAALTRACKAFGEVHLYVGDDGQIYCA